MEVIKQPNGKWLRATNGGCLTQTNETEDTKKVLVYEVYIHSSESVDSWAEIDTEEVERIRKAKEATKGSIDYPEAEVNQALDLLAATINTMSLTDEQSLQFKGLYPTWESFIGKSLSKDYKVQYEGRLYKVLQDISVVLSDQYPSINTAALYTEINETAAGTYEDPIPYNNNMELENGKYYSQDGIIYKCTRNTDIAVYNNLADLVNIYVEVATN